MTSKFAIWLPPALLVLGLYLLLKVRYPVAKIVGSLLACFGGLLTIYEIWLIMKQYYR